jgi:D-aminoacyl-tRNA deacylase
MKAVIQRVKKSSVAVDNQIIGEIGQGVLVLLGVAQNDEISDADFLADKIADLRIFKDENGKMNHCLKEIGGEMLVVSQFTLLGDCRKGRRPSFIDAAPPDKANHLYEVFINRVRQNEIPVKTGKFQAMMDVFLINDGPVTLILESKTEDGRRKAED